MPDLSPEEISKLTPMMRQYFEIKKRAQGSIIFFRMGDFYEIFGEDAEEVAPILDIVLTARASGDKKKIPFCGVPHHSAHGYLLKLLSKGYKVAVVDQVEDPKEAKGIVKRDIVRIYTPGCVDELAGLPKDSQNYLMAAYECPKSRTWAVTLLEVSTGEVRLGNCDTVDEVQSLIESFRPRELLVRQFQSKNFSNRLSALISDTGLMLESLPEEILREENDQKTILKNLLGRAGLSKQLCGDVQGGLALLASVFTYITNLKADTSQFMFVKPIKEPDTVMLSDIAIRDLELFETSRRRQAKGSLFHTINKTLSPMGARLLRWNLARPLFKIDKIRQRHDAIEGIISIGEKSVDELRMRLKGTPDLERIATRVLSGKVSPIELLKARETLDKAGWLFDAMSHFEKNLSKEKTSADLFTPILENLKKVEQARELLHARLCDSPNQLGTGTGVIKQGFSDELDKVSQLVNFGETQISDYESSLREQTGITSLKIKSHKTFGLLIEITKSNLSKVPTNFIRRQTMVNCERFITDELKELDESLSSAGDDAIRIEYELYQNLLQDLAGHYKALMSAAEAIATFDLLLSFAYLSIKDNYVKPTLNQNEKIRLLGSRHPVVESLIGKNHYVPNNINLTESAKQLLITGPNMAGKSTVMRQVAITAIIVQAGGFAPAHTAELPIFDQIYTRVGASDDLAKGQSTFMVEMSEAAQILRSSTSKSLVILDEVGRGTSTEDGLAIASAILEDIALRTQSWALFATHYHELVPFCNKFKTVKTVQTEVKEHQDGIKFTHKLIDGASGSSFGVEVARLAGMPEHVVKAAADYLSSHPGSKKQPREGAQFTPDKVQRSTTLQPKTTQNKCCSFDLEAELEKLNINRMTPISALNLLQKWQENIIQPPAVKQLGLFEGLN